MKVVPTPLSGVLVVEPDVYRDARGFFLENYHQKKYAAAGLPERFVQDNHSKSSRGILRGLHAQLSKPQGKLVRVIAGEIFDVVVDIRKGSPTYKGWFGVTLSAENFKQCYVPPGFAHGFCVTSDSAEVEYKVTDFYDPGDELHLIWNDPDLAISWPINDPILSPKDSAGLRLKDLENRLPSR
jgi:dTDP-4-dehydrorhamnose 3,5-epimerase